MLEYAPRGSAWTCPHFGQVTGTVSLFGSGMQFVVADPQRQSPGNRLTRQAQLGAGYPYSRTRTKKTRAGRCLRQRGTHKVAAAAALCYED
jgi:hypothetical protein